LTQDWKVKIADFGSAKSLYSNQELVKNKDVFYMAPERFDDEALPACDVYFYGIILWQLLTEVRRPHS